MLYIYIHFKSWNSNKEKQKGGESWKYKLYMQKQIEK